MYTRKILGLVHSLCWVLLLSISFMKFKVYSLKIQLKGLGEAQSMDASLIIINYLNSEIRTSSIFDQDIMHFRTRNVLVDENFTAKVSDFGLSNLRVEGYFAESSSASDCSLNPEFMG